MAENSPTLRKEKLHIQEVQQTPSVTDWKPFPSHVARLPQPTQRTLEAVGERLAPRI